MPPTRVRRGALWAATLAVIVGLTATVLLPETAARQPLAVYDERARAAAPEAEGRITSTLTEAPVPTVAGSGSSRTTPSSTRLATGSTQRTTTSTQRGRSRESASTSASSSTPAPEPTYPTTTTLYTGQDGPYVPYVPGLPYRVEVPRSSRGPMTWNTSLIAGRDLPVWSCGSYRPPGESIPWQRCYPAVWPPPELGEDPCLVAGGRAFAPALPSQTFDGPSAPSGYEPRIHLRADTDCAFYMFEGIRFLSVNWFQRGAIGATIDWGDGTSTDVGQLEKARWGCAPRQQGVLSIYSYEYGHRYTRGGTYTARVTITSGQCDETDPDAPMTDVRTTLLTTTRIVPGRLTALGA